MFVYAGGVFLDMMGEKHRKLLFCLLWRKKHHNMLINLLITLIHSKIFECPILRLVLRELKSWVIRGWEGYKKSFATRKSTPCLTSPPRYIDIPMTPFPVTGPGFQSSPLPVTLSPHRPRRTAIKQTTRRNRPNANPIAHQPALGRRAHISHSRPPLNRSALAGWTERQLVKWIQRSPTAGC